MDDACSNDSDQTHRSRRLPRVEQACAAYFVSFRLPMRFGRGCGWCIAPAGSL